MAASSDGRLEGLASPLPTNVEESSNNESVDFGWGSVAAAVPEVGACEQPSQEPVALFKLDLAQKQGRKRGRPPTKLKQVLGIVSSQEVAHGGPASGGSARSSAVVRRVAAKTHARPPAAQVPALACSMPAPLQGRLQAAPILSHFIAAQDYVLKEGSAETLDEIVQDMGNFYFTEGAYHLGSGKIMEKLLQYDQEALQSRVLRMCCALFWKQYCVRTCLEQEFTDKLARPSLVFYMDASCYDETPMKLAVKDPLYYNPSGASSA
eukprot:4868185-Amphidinium_carterae.1